MDGPAELELALKRIAGGSSTADECENEVLDFKEDNGRSQGDLTKIIAEAAICFANAAGGTIVVGVADKVKGRAAFTGTKLEPREVIQRVHDLSQPPLMVNARRHPDFPTITLIEVPQSAAIHADTQGRAYRRISTNCIAMTPHEQARLQEERQGFDWSGQPSGRSIDDVSPATVTYARSLLGSFRDLRRELATLSLEDLLSSIGALHSGRELNRAGELMFCSNTNEAGAIIYQYRVTPGGEPAAVHRLPPPILQSFSRTMELLHARQETTPLNLPSGQQIAIEDFPSDAVREAVSNAICHRDYHLTGPVHIEHSPTVFNVVSPGPLVAGVTMANIITTPSRPRNAALLKIARHLGLAEELGRGIDRMYREMIRSGLEAPKILGEFDHVKVTLVGGAPDTNLARFIAGLPEHEQNDTDTMLILLKLCQARTITATVASTILQKSESEAEAVLRRLSEDGVELLERTRATEGRSSPTYRLKSSSIRGLGSAVKYSRRSVDDIDRKVISHVQEYGRITNRTIQNFLDVHVFKARDIISDMVQRGVLKRISQQARGPKVEWGPGPNFPMVNSKSGATKKTPSNDDGQGSLFN